MRRILLIGLVLSSVALYAASHAGGSWTARVNGNRLEITLWSSGGHRNGNMTGFSADLANIKSLSAASLTTTNADVHFVLDRAAGTFDFEGHFNDRAGAGHYRFTTHPEFVREMEAFGYSGFRDDELLVFATTDFTPSTVSELRAMGYSPSRRQIEDVAIFRITPAFIRDVSRLGYPNLSLGELTDLRVGNVDERYITSMRELGYDHLSAHKLADLAILGVTPAYVRELNAAGLRDLTSAQLENLRVANITRARIEEYARAGYPNLSMQELEDFGLQSVTPKLIQELRQRGFDHLTPRQLIELRISGGAEVLLRKR